MILWTNQVCFESREDHLVIATTLSNSSCIFIFVAAAVVGGGELAPTAAAENVDEEPLLVPDGLDPAGAPALGARNDDDAGSNATGEDDNIDEPEAELLDSEAEEDIDEAGAAGTGTVTNAAGEGVNIAELLKNDDDSEKSSDTDSEDDSDGDDGVAFFQGQRVWDTKTRSLATVTDVRNAANGTRVWIKPDNGKRTWRAPDTLKSGP